MTERDLDRQLAELLSAYYEEAPMEASYRLELWQQTRQAVAARSRRRAWPKALAAVAATGLVAAALWLIWRPAAPQRAPAPPVASHPGVGGPAELPATASILGDEGSHPTSGRQAAAAAPSGPAVTVKRQALLRVVAVRGPATRGQGEALALGDTLSGGDVVRTGPGGRLRLVTRRGSELALNENSELAVVSAEAARLVGGEVYCRSREGEIKQLATPAGRIELLGTALDAALQEPRSVAVTVLHGSVRLANEHGEATVGAGRRGMLVAWAAPTVAGPADVRETTAWYDGRRDIVSDLGDIAYTVMRDYMVSEVWAMAADGSNKRRLKTFMGYGMPALSSAAWLPGEPLLVFQTRSALWTRPDFQRRSAHTTAGHPITKGRIWIINAATGDDAPFDLPQGYSPLYTSISPNGLRVAFSGSYRGDPEDRSTWEGGVWVYDLETGQVRKVLDGWIKTGVAWSPDSRMLVGSTGEGYGSDYPLVVVDTDTGKVRELGVQGAGASFSSDGRRIAYCGGFTRAGSWYQGVLTTGSIWVLDLEGGQARRISPDGEGALQPRWSPDGSRIAYHVRRERVINPDEGPVYFGYSIYVAAADGSGVREVYRQEPEPEAGDLQAVAWTPEGDALYLSTSRGVLLVAADGSGLIADLGGREADSPLSPEEREETEAALAAIREAIYQFAVGKVRSFEGRPHDSRAAFDAAAAAFAALPWNYPRVSFSIADTLAYADEAARLAARRPDEVLAESCQERLGYLGILLEQYLGKRDSFPANLAALEQASREDRWGINWIGNEDADWVAMMFRCPASGPFTYHPPAEGAAPEVGDVLVACSYHPGHQVVWTEEMQQQVAWRREAAASREAQQ